MTVSEKVTRIQSLYDGLGLDRKTSAEARILSEVLDVLRDVGLQLDGIDTDMDRLNGELDALEGAVFDAEDGDGFDGPDSLDGDSLIPCPNCGEELLVDDEVLAAGVVDCPVCGGRFALSFEDEDDSENE